jgi:ABC-type methionine transport system permease subunit
MASTMSYRGVSDTSTYMKQADASMLRPLLWGLLIGGILSTVWLVIFWLVFGQLKGTPIESALSDLHRPVTWVSEQLRLWLVDLGLVHSHSGIAALILLFIVFGLTGALLGGTIGMVVAVRRQRRTRKQSSGKR